VCLVVRVDTHTYTRSKKRTRIYAHKHKHRHSHTHTHAYRTSVYASLWTCRPCPVFLRQRSTQTQGVCVLCELGVCCTLHTKANVRVASIIAVLYVRVASIFTYVRVASIITVLYAVCTPLRL
jgi:hypothetical protein